MIPDATFLSLTDRQRQVLRLVYENFEAKEIAQRLDISPHTVNEYLRDARRILGVSRSIQAARIFAEYEGPKRLVSEPIGVVAHAALEEEGSEPTVPPSAHVGSNRYELSGIQRLGAILGLALLIVIVGGALLGTTDLVARLLTRYHVDISDGPYHH